MSADYELFEGKTRSNDISLTEAPMRRAFPRMKTDAERKAALEPSAGVPGQEPERIDIEYFSDQINELLTSLEDYHQELGTAVEMKGDETGDYMYETAEKQISRYMMGAVKTLEDLQKYLERQKGNL